MGESVPDWITKEFLTEVLKKEHSKENVIVTNFTATFAVPPGNNYGSTIIRLKVEYKFSHQDNQKYVSLILKAELTQGIVKEMFDFSSREAPFYYEFIPEAKRLMDMSFVPKTYTNPRPNDIILEDLKEQGFVMADRTKQLDYDHCRLYMITAAKLHAVSVAVYKQRPELIKLLGEEKIFLDKSDTAEMFKILCKYAMDIFVEETNKIDRFKKYAQIIKELIPCLWDMVIEAHKPREGLKTINQGDPWCTNMMFRYDEQGNVSDIKLLDFQCLRYATPVNDIMFFIWTSANNAVRKRNLNQLYDIYLTALNHNLEQLNCSERLSLEEFMKNVKRLSPIALYFTGVPSIVCPDPIDFGMIQHYRETGDDEELRSFFRNKVFSDEFCTNMLPGLLESLEINGVIEYLQNVESNVLHEGKDVLLGH